MLPGTGKKPTFTGHGISGELAPLHISMPTHTGILIGFPGDGSYALSMVAIASCLLIYMHAKTGFYLVFSSCITSQQLSLRE